MDRTRDCAGGFLDDGADVLYGADDYGAYPAAGLPVWALRKDGCFFWLLFVSVMVGSVSLLQFEAGSFSLQTLSAADSFGAPVVAILLQGISIYLSVGFYKKHNR